MGFKERIYILWWAGLAKLIAPQTDASLLVLHKTGEYISDQIRRTNCHYELANLVKVALLCRVQYFVDVGANIGNHSHFFSSLGVRGAAFEPSFENFTLLTANVPSFDLHNLALGSKNESSTLLTYSDSMGNSRLAGSGPANASEATGFQSVKIKTLDGFGFATIDLIKVDAEGSELEVLKGAVKTLGQTLPVIWIELHEDEHLNRAGVKYTRSEVIEFLKTLNYQSYIKLDSTNFLFAPERRFPFKGIHKFPTRLA